MLKAMVAEIGGRLVTPDGEIIDSEMSAQVHREAWQGETIAAVERMRRDLLAQADAEEERDSVERRRRRHHREVDGGAADAERLEELKKEAEDRLVSGE